MKQLITMMMLLLANTAMAQDVIITKDGDAMKVWGFEVSNSAVFYRESAKKDAPIKRMKKSDLLMIKYQDGRKEVIGDDSKDSSSNTASTQQESTSINQAIASEINEERIAAYNNQKVSWKEKPKAKNNYLFSYCKLNIEEGSVLESDEVSITIETGEYDDKGQYTSISHSANNQVIKVNARNKTNKTLYLDLGNTFFIRGGEAEPYYIPTATSEYGGNTTGASVNLGAVAGAMGIDGSIGKLANGINVGGASTKGTKTTVYSQRVISIPPMSSKSLEPHLFFPINYNIFPMIMSYEALKNTFTTTSILDLQQGDMIHWNAHNSPIHFSFFLSYAYDEQCDNVKTMKTDIYVTDLYCMCIKGAWANYKSFKKTIDYYLDKWETPLHFFVSNTKFSRIKSIKTIQINKNQLGGTIESVAQ